MHTLFPTHLTVLLVFVLALSDCFVLRFCTWRRCEETLERLRIRSCHRLCRHGIIASTSVGVPVATKFVSFCKRPWTATAGPFMTVKDIQGIHASVRMCIDGKHLAGQFRGLFWIFWIWIYRLFVTWLKSSMHAVGVECCVWLFHLEQCSLFVSLLLASSVQFVLCDTGGGDLGSRLGLGSPTKVEEFACRLGQ